MQKVPKGQRLCLWDGIYQKPFLLYAPKETVGKAVPAFRGQVSPDGDLLFARAKRRQKHAGGQARKNFKRQGRAFVLSACTPEPPFLRESRMRTAPHPIRRWGKPTLPAPDSRCRSSGSCGNSPGPRSTPSHSIGPARRSTVGCKQCYSGTHQRQRRWGQGVSWLPQRRSMSGRQQTLA